MNEYALSDKAIEILKKKAVMEFSKAKSQMSLDNFDELNVIQTVKELYKTLAKDNYAMFMQIAKQEYKAIGGKKSITKEWLDNILSDDDPVTLYVYLYEVDRKRERATENINASTKKAEQLRKALKYWVSMTEQYCDNILYQSAIQAYKDNGVTKVMWHTQEDEKVCEECEPLDGKTFSIDHLPEKHWGCRCFISPVQRV